MIQETCITRVLPVVVEARDPLNEFTRCLSHVREMEAYSKLLLVAISLTLYSNHLIPIIPNHCTL